MTLYDKIILIYPDLTIKDFHPLIGKIFLQNDSDEKGDYIKSWTHTSPQPTQEQLDAITG
jgi:hypothetical protein